MLQNRGPGDTMKYAALVFALLLHSACIPSNCDPGCTGSDGNCLTCAAPSTCNSGGTCSAVVNGVQCCNGGGGGSGGVCAHWSCGGSSQCTQVMGMPSGVQCQFAANQTCQQWCQTYVPGNCSCY